MRDDPEAPDGSEDEPPEPPEPPEGSIRPSSPASLGGWALAGVVLGWAVHQVYEQLGAVPPLVSWAQPLALGLLAAILGYTAWATRRTVHVRRERLLPHQAVNRLVLARACAVVGALVGGGYLGYGLSWLGDPAELADERVLRSLVAAAAGLVAAVAALLLERACRVRSHESQE